MQEKTASTKTLKGQLFTAVAMLIVAAVALGTSTYAWFVNSQTAEIDTMNFQASASSSLQIAVRDADGKVATPYKSVVYNTDIATTAGWTDMFTTRLTPASGVTPTGAFFEATGAQDAETSKLNKFQAVTPGTGSVKKIPLTFLTSASGNVYFGKQGGLTIDGLVEETGTVKDALRMAIVPEGGTALIFQFSETNDIAGATNNTFYPSTVTPADVSDAAGTYNAVASIVTTEGTTKGDIATIGTQTCIPTGTGNNYIATVTGPTSVVAGTTALFDLVANEPKNVDVYIWLEGTDAGCITGIANSAFTLALPFATPSAG